MAEEMRGGPRRMRVRRAPLGFSDLREEGGRVMEALLAPWRPFRVLAGELVGPPVDVFEEDHALHIEVELPGVRERNVEISASADALTVKGEKAVPTETEKRAYYWRERGHGNFVRSVDLPAGADIERATATFEDGVLHISVPLAGEPGTTKISITPSSEV